MGNGSQVRRVVASVSIERNKAVSVVVRLPRAASPACLCVFLSHPRASPVFPSNKGLHASGPHGAGYFAALGPRNSVLFKAPFADSVFQFCLFSHPLVAPVLPQFDLV